METLDTLTDAYYTEMAYQRDMKEQGKQNVANLNSSFETMTEIAANLFNMINSYRALTDQINSAAEAYSDSNFDYWSSLDANEQAHAYNYGMDLEKDS